MLLGLRTAVYRVPDLGQAKSSYAAAFGNAIGLIENPNFKASVTRQ